MRYRTVFRLEVEKGPNFAGHYRVVEWGCGSSCEMVAVVNLRSGRVITPEAFDRVSGVFFYADDFLPQKDSDGWGFRYKLDSRLLVAVGDLDEDESREGAFYFVLDREKLRSVYSTDVKKNCANAEHSKN
jgi:hypothetical protein